MIPEDEAVATIVEEQNEATPLVGSTKKESWNRPKENIIKVATVFLTFIQLGMTDSAIGAILPSVKVHYGLTDLEMSLVFVAPICGSLTSAMSSGFAHSKLGRRGVSRLGVFLCIVNFATISTNPPYWLMLLSFVSAGLGSGLMNGSYNGWIGAFDGAHSILGLLHGCYALGGMMGPAVVTLILKLDMPWFYYYHCMLFLGIFIWFCSFFSFRHDTAEEYYRRTHSEENLAGSGGKIDHTEVFRTPQVWLLALMLCTYNGVELGYSGWVVTYMDRTRHGDPKTMGLVSTCFWTGLTSGRVILGFVTGRFKDLNKVVCTYFALGVTFHLIFWSWTSAPIAVSAGIVSIVGFFVGPIFPCGMVLATSVLPKRLHVSGISTSAALSGCGASLLPLIIGGFVTVFSAKVIPSVVFVYYLIHISLWLKLASSRRPEPIEE